MKGDVGALQAMLARDHSTVSVQQPGESSRSLHARLVMESKGVDVMEKYEVVSVLGEGSMGRISKVKIRSSKIGGSAFEFKSKRLFGLLGSKTVRSGHLEGTHTNENRNSETSIGSSQDRFYALKAIRLNRLTRPYIEELTNEIEILRTMDHPNIVKAHEVFYYRRQIYLILELCDGGDLYTRNPYSEKSAGRIVAKLLSAVRYMHDHGVVHRDLKFENVMFESTADNAEIKLIDFGLSKKFIGQPASMTGRVGTIYSMAPQVLQGIYSSKADLWSLGVITYMLLSNSMPFYHQRRPVTIDKIMRGDYKMQDRIWDSVSDDAKDFINQLLVVDPRHRIDATEALKHEWIVNREHLPDEISSEELSRAIDGSLLRYIHTSELKKLALNVIAYRSTAADIMQLRNAFETYDTEMNGALSYEEFEAALRKMSYAPDMLKEIFVSLDVNKNGYIQYTEFLAATIETFGNIEEGRIADAFDRLDCDDSGFITKANLREVLGQECTNETAARLIKDADFNNDGKISYEEFLAFFRREFDEMTDRIAAQATSVSGSDGESRDLYGLDAKIPGGRYDSDLTSSEKKQAEQQQAQEATH